MELINKNYKNTEDEIEELSDEVYLNPEENEFEDLEEAVSLIMIDDEYNDDGDKLSMSNYEDNPVVFEIDDSGSN